MKIPSVIRIGGVDYAVVQTPRLNNGEKMAYGHIDYEKAVIEYNPDNCKDSQFIGRILWHEILHGIAEHANLEIGSDEESVIDTLAKGIYQVLQDNGRKLFDIVEK